MRRALGSWIFVGVMIILDVYIFQVIRILTQSAHPKLRLTIHVLYWSVSALAMIAIILMPYLNIDSWPKTVRAYIFATLIGLFLSKLMAATFFVLDDLRRLLQWSGGKLFYGIIQGEDYHGSTINRSAFLNWLGIAAGSVFFSSLIWGFRNKYRYTYKKLDLAFQNLPQAFRGLKIAQISDIHSGSFMDKAAVLRGVEMVMQQKPDLILFTGDLVNDRAIEMAEYMDVFNKLQAPLGVFSTLGNHDYGDYFFGRNPTGAKAKEKEDNLARLKEIHGELGWRLLLDEHVVLEKGQDKIALIGVQNISGKSTFHSYGDLHKAYTGAENHAFKILMSHDPSHWDAEVRTSFSDIDLTLSGHTHGMQYGIEIPGIKWSPVQYMYKQWHGLYEAGNQKLYVNPGFGFIGYPGRVGILPEITLFHLV